MPSNWVPRRIKQQDNSETQNVSNDRDSLQKSSKAEASKVNSRFRGSSKITGTIVIIGIVLLAVGFWYGSKTLKYWKEPAEKDVVLSEDDVVRDDSSPRTFESPINGELYTASEYKDLLNKKPLAVMINNHVEARPQAGVSRADVVYEVVAEGGITRFLGIFHSKDANHLGSIRSIRTYYAIIAAEYDPWLVHAGGSSSDVPEADGYGFVRAEGIPQVDYVTGWGSSAFDRVKGKVAPHNLYVSTVRAREEAEKLYKGWPLKPIFPKGWDFKNEDELNTAIGADRQVVDIEFWKTPGYEVRWEYDEDTNSYLRFQGGEKHMDESANKQIEVKNVIIQYVNERPANDGKNHLIYDLIGSGDARFNIDGKEYEGTWVKTELKKRTKFYLRNGDDVKFNRGLIWVEVVPSRNREGSSEVKDL